MKYFAWTKDGYGQILHDKSIGDQKWKPRFIVSLPTHEENLSLNELMEIYKDKLDIGEQPSKKIVIGTGMVPQTDKQG